MPASVIDLGSGDSQRSGFHSCASSPQKYSLVLQPCIPMMTSVSAGTAISEMTLPLVPTMGFESGKTVALFALRTIGSVRCNRLHSKQGNVHAAGQKQRRISKGAAKVVSDLSQNNQIYSQSQYLSTDSVQIRQAHEAIVIQLATVERLGHLYT